MDPGEAGVAPAKETSPVDGESGEDDEMGDILGDEILLPEEREEAEVDDKPVVDR